MCLNFVVCSCSHVHLAMEAIDFLHATVALFIFTQHTESTIHRCRKQGLGAFAPPVFTVTHSMGM